MINDRTDDRAFRAGDEVVLDRGTYQGTPGVFVRFQMHAEILSWSRSEGVFAGIALEGATLREDLDDNAALYGSKLENRAIVTNGMAAPESGAALIALLNKYSRHERAAREQQ